MDTNTETVVELELGELVGAYGPALVAGTELVLVVTDERTGTVRMSGPDAQMEKVLRERWAQWAPVDGLAAGRWVKVRGELVE